MLTNCPGLMAGATVGAWTFKIHVARATGRFSRISPSACFGTSGASRGGGCGTAREGSTRAGGAPADAKCARRAGDRYLLAVPQTLPQSRAAGFVLTREGAHGEPQYLLLVNRR